MALFSTDFMKALYIVSSDPEMREPWGKIGQKSGTVLRMFGEEGDPEFIAERIKALIRTEATKLQAAERDIALHELSPEERTALGFHSEGQKMLARLAHGDREALDPARALSEEIIKKRRELGVD